LACGEKEPESQEEVTPISATLRLLSVTNGRSISDVNVDSEMDSSITGEDGRATVTITADEEYSLTASQEGSMNHVYQGIAGTEDFEIVGFLVDRSTTNMVFSSMGISQDSDKGIVVAALDKPDLSPAVDASATLDSDSTPFTFAASGFPEAGNVIQNGGSSFVFFPNVETGDIELTASYENGECTAFPAGESSNTVSVDEDTVSVVVYTCQ
jgi:hypothetical protein